MMQESPLPSRLVKAQTTAFSEACGTSYTCIDSQT